MEQLSPEGRVWLDKYFQELGAFSASGLTDFGALGNAAQALEFLLQRSPGAGAFVQRLSTQAAMISRNGRPDIMIRFADNGLAASVTYYSDNPTAVGRVNALLLLLIAEARLNADERTKGIQALNKIKNTALGNDPIDDYLRGIEGYFSARFEEEIQEKHKAVEAYTQAIALLGPLLQDKTRQAAFLADWAELVYGPEMQGGTPEQQQAVPMLELKSKLTQSGFGLVRCQDVLTDATLQHTNALQALDLLEQTGLTISVDPFSLISVLSWLPEAEGRQQEARLLALVGDNKPDWHVAIQTGIAAGLHRVGNFKEAASLAFEAQQLANKDTSSIASVFTSGLLTVITHVHKAKNARPYADYFQKALALAVFKNPAVWRDPYYRSLFEQPLLAVIENMLRDFPTATDNLQSIQLSILLDATKTGETPDFQIFMEAYAGMRGKSGKAVEGIQLADDSLGRVQVALPVGALAMLVQPLAEGTGFLLLSASWQRPVWVTAGREWAGSVTLLQETVGESLEDLQLLGNADPGPLAEAGEALFAALPPEVQAAIGQHETLLLIPDYSADGGVLPFELLPIDGKFLGAEKVLARYISLRHLARSLDAGRRPPHQGRALITPIMDATSLEADRLLSAGPECAAIAELLGAAKYEIPVVDPAQLTPGYYTDRLSFLDVLHIAAHGESQEGDEWLLLPGEARFVVDDLDVRKQRSLPFVYLNTCHLGFTRYLGAGVRRGFAFNLIEAGAPAVIANTIETLDEETARLSIGFYRQALTMPVGEALRETRRDLLGKGVSPIIWGSALLFGDPFYALPVPSVGAQPGDVPISVNPFSPRVSLFQPGLAYRLLDVFAGFGVEDKEAVWTQVIEVLDYVYNPLLEASMSLLQAGEEWGELPEDQKAAMSVQLIRLADKLDHMPAMASFRLTEFQRLQDVGAYREAHVAAEELILYLDALAIGDEKWGQVLTQIRAQKKRLELAFEGRSPSFHGPRTAESDAVLTAAVDTIYSAQEKSALYAQVALREEHSAADMVWNAIVLGHGGRFEDARETMEFVRELSRKLVAAGALPTTMPSHAPRLLAGMLKYCWSVQNLSYLAPEIATGQAGTVMALLADINAHWDEVLQSPAGAKLAAFEAELDKQLVFLDELAWEEIYTHLDVAFDGLAAAAKQVLAEIQKEYPVGHPLCSAYLSGLIIDKNVFSYLGGSVPEDMQKKMDDLYWAISADQERDFWAYLVKGYEGERNKALSDVERWWMGGGEMEE